MTIDWSKWTLPEPAPPIARIADVPRDAYHADEVADQPTLSASIAHLLCSRSPAHAFAAHPKLNPDYVRVEEQKYDRGTACHALLLEGVDAVEIINADDWRTKVAQEARDEARANGRIPMLAKDAADLARMVSAVQEQLDPPLLVEGKPEQTLVWEEPNGVVCRSRLDWLRDDGACIYDLKTTARSAHPSAYERALCDIGGDIQAAMYLRGLEAVTGDDAVADFVWIVVEAAPPYAVSLIRPALDLLELGEQKVLWAIDVWAECLATEEWPGYNNGIVTAHAPPWELSRWQKIAV